MSPNSVEAPFYYLAGPMTKLPKFNFPRFIEVATKLREAGENIVNPAELDDPKTFQWAMQSTNGSHGTADGYGDDYLRFLRRDVAIVVHPNCQGVICLEGWEDSRGARIETFLAREFELETLLYFDTSGGGYELVPFDRQEALLARWQEAEEVAAAQKSILEHIDPPRVGAN